MNFILLRLLRCLFYAVENRVEIIRLKEDIMSYMEENSEEMFRERNGRFLAVISRWRDGELKKVQDKSKE